HYLRWGREGGWRELEPSRANLYLFETRRGERYELRLAPERSPSGPAAMIPLYLASLAVGCTYLGIGIFVWLMRRDRDESWAFAIFCAAMAAELFTAYDTFRQTAGYERSVVNFGLVGASVFQLFTTYPFVPR